MHTFAGGLAWIERQSCLTTIFNDVYHRIYCQLIEAFTQITTRGRSIRFFRCKHIFTYHRARILTEANFH